jgi:uncharacterized surface protein with fasciclin (FAS1) repeats
MKYTNIAALFLTSLVALGACGDNLAGPGPKADAKPSTPDAAVAQKTIAELAVATPDLSSLVAAVKFASNNDDLLKLISDPGNLTVFAPTNAAFDKLAQLLTGMPTAKAADILVPANKELVRAVLRYHVVTSEVKAAAIEFGKPVKSASGLVFLINAGTPPVITDGSGPNAKIVTTDIDASNGVVHIIDSVMLPPSKTIGQLVEDTMNPMLSTLKAALGPAGAPELTTQLKGPGTFTVFAPNNAAFEAAITELNTTAALLLSNKPRLQKILTYHALVMTVFKAQIPFDTNIATVEGENIKIDNTFKITDTRGRKAQIIAADTIATNGVIHFIDKVILPATLPN